MRIFYTEKRNELLCSTTRAPSRIILLWSLVTFLRYAIELASLGNFFFRTRKQVSHVTPLLRFQTTASVAFCFYTFFLLTRSFAKQRASEKVGTAISYVCFVSLAVEALDGALEKFSARTRQFHRAPFRFWFHRIEVKQILRWSCFSFVNCAPTFV